MKKWFTLVELMIVIAIIWILAAVLYPTITGYFERTRDTKKKHELWRIEIALINYEIDHWTYKVLGYGDNFTPGPNGQPIELPEWQWSGWVNYTSEQYKKSIIEWLTKWWYLRGIEIIPLSKRKDTKNPNNRCNQNLIRWKDLYLLRTNHDWSRYTLSTYLEISATQQDYEHLLTLHDWAHICNWAWHNYWIWN